MSSLLWEYTDWEVWPSAPAPGLETVAVCRVLRKKNSVKFLKNLYFSSFSTISFSCLPDKMIEKIYVKFKDLLG